MDLAIGITAAILGAIAGILIAVGAYSVGWERGYEKGFAAADEVSEVCRRLRRMQKLEEEANR